MNRDQKGAVIEEIAGQIEQSSAVFAVDYRGITVAQAAELRARLREGDASFRVVKNSLTERAAERAGAAELKQLLVGPTAMAFVRGDAALAAKALAEFGGRGTQALTFKGGLLDGRPLSVEQLQTIARLPGRDVLHAQLVGMVAAPVTSLVRGLGSLIGGLAVALGQIAERGLVGGPAPTEPSAAAPAEGGAQSAEPTAEGGAQSAEPTAEGGAQSAEPTAEGGAQSAEPTAEDGTSNTDNAAQSATEPDAGAEAGA